MRPMDLPVMPPVAPMLARSLPSLPPGAMSFEPKWDGFRSIVFRDGPEVEIGSRNERPMTRYFPELVEAVLAQLPGRCVIDGEIVLVGATGDRLDFERLQQRIHPAASRVAMLAAATPARFVAFDLLALGDTDYTRRPFAERRAALEEALGGARAPIHLTPATTDPTVAERWFHQFEGAGLDGLIAKPLDGVYQPGRRVMIKVKHHRTADCVVAGYRLHAGSTRRIGSLMLGLYTEEGHLAHVGVAGAFPLARRAELFDELQPLVTTFDGHPWAWAQQEDATPSRRQWTGHRWAAGKDLSFVPLRPERVVEVAYDHMEGARFRHTAQFVRWRTDRDPRSCTYAQLEEAVSFDLADVLGAGAERPSIFEFAGGAPAFAALAAAHHQRCLEDPLLNHPFSHGGHPQHVERLAAYWAEVFGGPPAYSEGCGSHSSMLGLHAGVGAPEEMGVRFVECFVRAADDARLPDDPALRAAMRAYMEAAVAEVMACSPPGSAVEGGLAVPRWGWSGRQ